MKKFSLFLLAATVLILCVACNSNVSDSFSDKPVNLSLSLKEPALSRALATTNDLDVASYKYKAVCNTNAGAHGTQDTWADLAVVSDSATLSVASGNWTITIQCFNSKGGLLLEGEVTDDISQSNKSITVNCYAKLSTSGNAAVTVDAGVPTLTNGVFEIRYALVGSSLPSSANKTIAKAASVADKTSGGAEKAGWSEYKDTTISLTPGNYIMQLLYKDGSNVVSGQVLVFRAVEDTPITIAGELAAGEYIDMDLAIVTDETELTVTIGGTAPAYTTTVTPATATNLAYTWYVDGVAVSGQTSANFSGTIANAGEHIVSVVVTGKLNDKQIVGSASVVYNKE